MALKVLVTYKIKPGHREAFLTDTAAIRPQILAEDAQIREALDYTWYIIKAWDVDGTRLNEPWFKGPFGIANYVRHFFRPAPTRQVDWTFPLHYKNVHFEDTIPETKALQDLIDRLNPKFL